MDLQHKLRPTPAHRARLHEAVAHQPATQADWKPLQLSQLHWPLSAPLPAHPSPNMWEWWHQLRDWSKVAKHALVFSYRKCRKGLETESQTTDAMTSKMELSFFRSHYFRKQRHSRHFGEALYDNHLQKPGCMSRPHPKVECCIVSVIIHVQKQLHSHHFGGAYCIVHYYLQKPGCMSYPRPKVECSHSPHEMSIRKQLHGHHFGEELYEHPPADTWVYVTPSSKGGMLHCLSRLRPQATAQPSLRRSTVWQPPAETWVYATPLSTGGMSHRPSTFCPQAAAQPSLRRSAVWQPPAETWMYVTPSSKGGMLHCPHSLCPQATAKPSLRRSTVW